MKSLSQYTKRTKLVQCRMFVRDRQWKRVPTRVSLWSLWNTNFRQKMFQTLKICWFSLSSSLKFKVEQGIIVYCYVTLLVQSVVRNLRNMAFWKEFTGRVKKPLKGNKDFNVKTKERIIIDWQPLLYTI